jgi:MoxR-like ATPase
MATDIERLLDSANRIILGKPKQIKLALACLLAQGHLLIEDLPGVGKTTLAHLLAKLFGLNYNRIQFTSDLLPSDIVGVSIFDREQQSFSFHPGPVFAQLVLADEINRATPKTQSALLEAMEEGQVTSDGQTHSLPRPFFVVATQNPAHQVGTFPLPESQLDRFLMRIHLGYPDRRAEFLLLSGEDRRSVIDTMQPVVGNHLLQEMQGRVLQVHAEPPLLAYLQDLLEQSRGMKQFAQGLSPRAGLSILKSARAWAFLEDRDYLLPEDIQAIFPSCVDHRLNPVEHESGDSHSSPGQQILDTVRVP